MLSRIFQFAFAFFPLLLVAVPNTTHAAFNEDALTIGSIAPELDIEHWVSNGEGKFKPVTAFRPGSVYIVEFWATWCGPCIQSMPHLVELQEKYSGKGLQIISISDETVDTVQAFLKRTVPNTAVQAMILTCEHPDKTESQLLSLLESKGTSNGSATHLRSTNRWRKFSTTLGTESPTPSNLTKTRKLLKSSRRC